jgi:hypothetical protein
MTNDGTADYVRECNVRWGTLAEVLGARGIALVDDGGFAYTRRAVREGHRASVSVYLHAPHSNIWGRGRPDFEIEVASSHDRRQTFKSGKEGFDWQKIADKIERSLRASEAKLATQAEEKERYNAARAALLLVAQGLGLAGGNGISDRIGGVASPTSDGDVSFVFRCSVGQASEVLWLLKRVGIAKLEGEPDDPTA